MKYTYGADFSARERKRINDILYRMKKEGYNITQETRKFITNPKNVREQAAEHVTFRAISKRGNKVGPEYSGSQALKLHRLAVEYNRKIDAAKRKKKYKGYDLESYKANTSLTGLGPSTIKSKKGFMETTEEYEQRLKEEGEKAVRAAEKAWSRDIEQALDDKKETAIQNFLGVLGNGYATSLDLPEELIKDIESKIKSMSYKDFTELMKDIVSGESNIFEFYKSGYEDVENGLRSLFIKLGYDVEERRSLSGAGFDAKDNTIYLQDIMDNM